MNDELELALSGLRRTDITPPPLRIVVHGARRRTRRRRAATTVLGILVLLGAVGAFGAALDQDPSTTITSNETTTSSPVTTSTLPATAPSGYDSVTDGEGHIVGYLSRADVQQALEEGEPVLDIGTGAYEIRGLRVVDLEGETVGYYLRGPAGFVSLAEVADPLVADELGKDQQAEPQSQEEGRELLEQLNDN